MILDLKLNLIFPEIFGQDLITLAKELQDQNTQEENSKLSKETINLKDVLKCYESFAE